MPKKKKKKTKSKKKNSKKVKSRSKIKRKKISKKIKKKSKSQKQEIKEVSEVIIKTKPEWIKSSLANKSKYQQKYSQSIKSNDEFWRKEGKRITWIKPYKKIKDVIQSNSLLLNAQISLTNAERNYLLAQYNLLKSIGLLTSSYLNLK